MTTQETGTQSRRRIGWSRLSLGIMAAGLAALAAAAVLFVLTFTGYLGDKGYSGPGTATTFSQPIDFESLVQPTAVPPSEAPIARLAIPKFEVDAPVVIRGVNASGIMETPDGPEQVAWYDFTARPGFGSNAVFSGHVDYINYGPAVFWHLKDLAPGDIVEVRLEDGTVYQYAVASREQVYAATADTGKIVGPTPGDIITLITCGGTFDSGTDQYDQRVIVTASRVYDSSPPAADAAPSS